MGALLLLAIITLVWWRLRPNRARVDPRLEAETWDVVTDGLHNSNTDLVYWRDAFWLAHAASPYHMGSKECRIVVRRSADGRRFEHVADLRVSGEDIRDPKFAAIGDELFLYALPNRGFYAIPYGTVYARSADGVRWSSFAPVEIEGAAPRGWLFWRPKTRDGVTWLVPAYWNEHGHSILLRSTDGVRWSAVSRIWDGEANDETDFEHVEGGAILATARLEMAPDRLLGHRDASTLLAYAEPPYTSWTYARSRVTRLDGPALFSHGGRVYAVARRQPGRKRFPTWMASALARKRTALFLVERDRLVWLSDLPSAGDTSYAGVVLRGGELWASYYTSDVRRDYPWILGMVLRSDVRMARVPLAKLALLAEERGRR
jgi:hypothetical protein